MVLSTTQAPLASTTAPGKLLLHTPKQSSAFTIQQVVHMVIAVMHMTIAAG